MCVDEKCHENYNYKLFVDGHIPQCTKSSPDRPPFQNSWSSVGGKRSNLAKLALNLVTIGMGDTDFTIYEYGSIQQYPFGHNPSHHQIN